MASQFSDIVQSGVRSAITSMQARLIYAKISEEAFSSFFFETLNEIKFNC